MSILSATDIFISMGLAFGIGKKNRVCSVLAVIYGIFGVITAVFSTLLQSVTGRVRRAGRKIVTKVAIVGTFIAAYQKITRFHVQDHKQ